MTWVKQINLFMYCAELLASRAFLPGEQLRNSKEFLVFWGTCETWSWHSVVVLRGQGLTLPERTGTSAGLTAATCGGT